MILKQIIARLLKASYLKCKTIKRLIDGNVKTPIMWFYYLKISNLEIKQEIIDIKFLEYINTIFLTNYSKEYKPLPFNVNNENGELIQLPEHLGYVYNNTLSILEKELENNQDLIHNLSDDSLTNIETKYLLEMDNVENLYHKRCILESLILTKVLLKTYKLLFDL